MVRILVLVCAMIGLGWGAPAEARRAALIIGNSNYSHAPVLPNPSRDADLVAESAKKAGFEVTVLNDLGMADFQQALREFRQMADGSEVAMIYFAGHGIESAGANFVIPTDAQLSESRDLRFEAIDLNGLLETLIGSQLRIVVLDACRENPFGNSWRAATRSIPRGLAEERAEGALVIYAAAQGQLATDGNGDNSPFARSLANRLAERGLSIHRLDSMIRDDVTRETNGQQTPWSSKSIDGRDFALVPSVDAPQAGASAVAASAPAYDAKSDGMSWRYYDEQGTADAYKSYLQEFPTGMFAMQAKQRLAQVNGEEPQAPAAASPPVFSGAPRPAAAVPAPARPAPVAARPAPVPAPPKAAPAAVVTPPTAAPAAASTGVSNANIAAVSQIADRAPLPQLPSTPLFPSSGYPACREEFSSVTDPIGKVNSINQCLSKLGSYFETTMNGFSESMIAHQKSITQLYQEQVGGQDRYTPESQNRFYKSMMQEHTNSNPSGPHFDAYRAAKKRYDDDRAYLQDRYCASTGACGGYPVPAGIAPAPRR